MKNKPLAYRMRPETLEEIVGQDHILGKDKPLYRIIKADRLSSIILWGPPGTGKTSIAEVLAKTTKHKFEKLNAVTAGIADIKRVIEDSENILLNPSGKSILFIDEIHRFNKSQQDVLLPNVEKGNIILIGATTENPYFEINKALISRSTIFNLKRISSDDLVKLLKKALISEKGLKEYNVKISDETLKQIATLSNGDIRSALNSLEIAVLSTEISSDGSINITKEDISNCFPERKQFFDKASDEHYDTISAMIKSIRGSDPDAAVHYLAKAIASGEDPMFLARRLIILSVEDIGLANPNALTLATSTAEAVKFIGMPEGRIALSEAAIYLANSKKSNTAYVAINMAIEDVKKNDTGEIPMHIRNSAKKGMEKFGYGKGYKYPHDYKDGKIEQQYLPDKLIGRRYYIDKWGNDKFE